MLQDDVVWRYMFVSVALWQCWFPFGSLVECWMFVTSFCFKWSQFPFWLAYVPLLYPLLNILTITPALFFFNIYLFIYFWLRWVFVAARGLSLAAASGGYSSLRCAGFSLRWLLLLQSTGSRCAGFSSCGVWALEHRLSSCGARA